MIRLDTKKGIKRAAEQLMKDAGVSKLDALNIHLGKYKSQRRFQAFIRRKQDKVEKTTDMTCKICSLFIVSGIYVLANQRYWHGILFRHVKEKYG
jgi:hypothetical protein